MKLEKSIETSLQKSLLNEKLHAKDPKPRTPEEAQKEAASLNNLQQATEQVMRVWVKV